jgi:hypothetical protein
MNTHIWIVKILAGLVSIFQASTLRDRLYAALDRVETLETAIMDIERISASRVSESQRLSLIKGICERVQDLDD